MTRESAESATPRVAAYARTAIDHKSIIDRQLEVCDELARERGWRVSRTYVDNGVSGVAPRRPSLSKLEADIERGELDAVIIVELDRLARRFVDVDRFAALCEGNGVELVIGSRS
jgi:DNA invertase Pin-like site-specific DNA recombinase